MIIGKYNFEDIGDNKIRITRPNQFMDISLVVYKTTMEMLLEALLASHAVDDGYKMEIK